jgi:hypothetical protein
MSNHHPKFLLKMNSCLHPVFNLFENVIHPAAGKAVAEKKKKRNSASKSLPKGTPDSLNIRALYKIENGVRRNPAP